MSARRDNKIILYDIGMSNDGHRLSYFLFLSKNFYLERIDSLLGAIFSPWPVLVPMIEASFVKYVIASLFRSLLRKRTVGFLFRPLPALQREGFRLQFKYWILFLMRWLPNATTLTIMPFKVEPGFSKIADGWIFDPQLWDLEAERVIKEEKKIAAHDVINQLASSKSGRRVCVALGRQDKSKGFDLFCRIFLEYAAVRNSLLFAFGGVVSGDMEELSECFCNVGGLAYNDFIDDSVLLQLYDNADIVWCVYDAMYNQASGIFGRAVQLGVPVAVRRGSLIHSLCQLEAIPHVAISGLEEFNLIVEIPKREPSEITIGRVNRMRAESLAVLRKALFGDLN